MELYKEILAKLLESFEINITFTGLDINAEKIIELKSYTALNKIKSIIEDNSLSDPECFTKIEEIICVFEDLGSGGGCRHDF